ncbi:MAG: outer membrane beta-barrel protein, partial [Candidatus Cryptobacteroides sp.]
MRIKQIYCIIIAIAFIPAGAFAKKQPKAVIPVRDTVLAETPDSAFIQIGDSTVTAVHSGDTLSIGFEPEYSDEYLDTVNIKKKKTINDYSMIGVQYGIALNQMRFNPSKKQGILMTPVNFGVVYTRYGKMFGYMPYFGFQAGLFYGQDGYIFKKDKETGDYTETVDGAVKATYSYLEVPLLAHLH